MTCASLCGALSLILNQCFSAVLSGLLFWPNSMMTKRHSPPTRAGVAWMFTNELLKSAIDLLKSVN